MSAENITRRPNTEARPSLADRGPGFDLENPIGVTFIPEHQGQRKFNVPIKMLTGGLTGVVLGVLGRSPIEAHASSKDIPDNPEDRAQFWQRPSDAADLSRFGLSLPDESQVDYMGGGDGDGGPDPDHKGGTGGDGFNPEQLGSLPEVTQSADEPFIVTSHLDGANIRSCDGLGAIKFFSGSVTVEVKKVFTETLNGTLYTWVGGTVTAGGETYQDACIADSVLRAGSDQSSPMPSVESIEQVLKIRAVPTLDQLSEKWDAGDGQKAGTIEIPNDSFGGGGVPESRYEDTVARMLTAASEAGIEGATIAVVSRGQGENTVYFPIMRTQDGAILMFRTENGELKAVMPSGRGATPVELPGLPDNTAKLAADFTENGPQYVGLDSNGFAKYRFDAETGQWVEMEVPTVDMLTPDELNNLNSQITERFAFRANRPTPELNNFVIRFQIQGYVVGVVRETQYLGSDLYMVMVPSSEGIRYVTAYSHDGSYDGFLENTRKVLQGELTAAQAQVSGDLSAIGADYSVNPELAEKLCNNTGFQGDCREWVGTQIQSPSIPLSRLMSVEPTSTPQDFFLWLVLR